MTPPYERKKIGIKLEIDEKTFPPCHAKEVEKWRERSEHQWKQDFGEYGKYIKI